MKLLLVLEHHFFKDENEKYWSERVIDSKYLLRYLSAFEELTICARVGSIMSSGVGDMFPIDDTRISFCGLPDCRGKGIALRLARFKYLMKRAAVQSDAVLLRAPSPISILFYHFAHRICKVISIEMIGAAYNVQEKNIIKKLFGAIVDRYVKNMCKRANGVSYVTDRVLQDRYPCQALMQGKENDSYFTGTYVDVNLDDSLFNPKKWLENKSVFVIGHTGYMNELLKGHREVMLCGAALIKKGYDIRIEFIGDGLKLPYLKNVAENLKIDNRVLFWGAINDKKKLLRLLGEMDLFLMPTRLEGLPRSIIEAMSQGVPCISSPVDGVPELLEATELFHYEDISGMVSRIEQLVNNSDERIKIGNRNFEKSMKFKYSEQKRNEVAFYKKIERCCEWKASNS